MRCFSFVLILCLFSSLAWAGPKVALTTTKGAVVVELDAEKAPISVENFLRYVREGFYEGTVFHRVIKDFMIQGGGMDATMAQKKGHDSIKNEAANGLKNVKYTIAMARTGEIDSATSQFFINTADNAFLDHGARDYGYAVFGKVVDGQAVVDAIEAVQTNSRDVPSEAIVITKAEVLE